MSRIKRVTVMSPQTRLARGRPRSRRRWRVPRLGQYQADRANRLYRSQRATGLVTLALLLALLLGLPVVFSIWPELDHVRWCGIPVSWLMVAIVPFPAMVALARWQLRQAERIEDRG